MTDESRNPSLASVSSTETPSWSFLTNHARVLVCVAEDPGMRPYDGRAIPTFVRQARENKPLTVFGDGSQTRSFCYVDDMIRGLYALAMSEEHLPVNLGNPTELSLLELAQTVLKVTSSKSEIVYEALPVDDPQVRQPDITRARQVVGWEPEIGIEEGLRRMLPSEEREAEALHA